MRLSRQVRPKFEQNSRSQTRHAPSFWLWSKHRSATNSRGDELQDGGVKGGGSETVGDRGREGKIEETGSRRSCAWRETHAGMHICVRRMKVIEVLSCDGKHVMREFKEVRESALGTT